MICIICPKSCQLTVDDSLNISGALCPRGVAYAKKETVSPERVVTSTAAVKGGLYPRLSVRTSAAISKSLMFEAIALLNKVNCVCPISVGDVIVKDILSTGIDWIATKEMKAIDHSL